MIMRNHVSTSVKLERIDICDLMLACTMSQFSANDGGKKWARLHDKLKQQLEDLDRELDQLEELDRYLAEN